MRSDWVRTAGKWQHIIWLFTNAAPELLDEQTAPMGNTGLSLLDRLTDSWEHKGPGFTELTISYPSRRLVLFAPAVHPWDAIGDSWRQTVWLPSEGGTGLTESEFGVLLELVLNSWI